MKNTNHITDIDFTINEILYLREGDEEYGIIEVSDIGIAEELGLNVTYSQRYDEYYIDSILAEEYEFTKEELTAFIDVRVITSPATETKRSVMIEAWSLFKSGIFNTFSIALKAAWNKIRLSKRLSAGIAYFSFIKVDGSIRRAIGTLREGNFTYEFKGKNQKNESVISYFDIEKRGWRSCRIDRVIEIS